MSWLSEFWHRTRFVIVGWSQKGPTRCGRDGSATSGAQKGGLNESSRPAIELGALGPGFPWAESHRLMLIFIIPHREGGDYYVWFEL